MPVTTVTSSGRAQPRPSDRRTSGQMFLVLLGFGLVPLLAMGVAGLVAARAALVTRMHNVVEAMVRNRTATVELFLDETMQQLEVVAEALPVSQLGRSEVLAAVLERTRRGRGAIVDLGLIGADGRHVAYVGPYHLESFDYSSQPWFTQVMVLGRYESDVFLGFRRFPHMVMAVKKSEAGRDWVLRATINTGLLSDLVREGGVESGAEVFVLNRAGEYQTESSPSHKLMEKSDLGPVARHSGVRVAEREIEGERELVATAWLASGAWVLVARQPVPGFSVLADAHPAVVGGFAFGLVVVPLLSLLIARSRLRQMRSLETERAALFESAAQSQKMAAIGRLAAGVAHEINNPIAIIQAQAGVISDLIEDAEESPLVTQARARIATIGAQVERVRRVTHRLLGFSRRVGPELEPVDVAAALDETVGFVEKELAASNVKLVREYASTLPLVRSSLSQMQQVFLNLINNALDALGGRGELRLGVAQGDGGVVVRVADNGPGIPEKRLARIFEPFFSTKGSDQPHSGLGLAICSEIMRGLKGTIAVRSVEGEGTEFTLFFPFDAEGE